MREETTEQGRERERERDGKRVGWKVARTKERERERERKREKDREGTCTLTKKEGVYTQVGVHGLSPSLSLSLAYIYTTYLSLHIFVTAHREGTCTLTERVWGNICSHSRRERDRMHT